MRVAIIADDLTGACDAAVHFAARGLETQVSLDGTVPGCAVAAFTTDSRDVDAGTARSRILALSAKLSPQLLFLKIDSVLRGNPGREIALTLAAFDYDSAVITPAYPEMGRAVKNGILQVPDTIDIAARLKAEGLDPERCQILDASTNKDLANIVDQFGGERILWCGSGGLALALAQHMAPGLPAHHAAPAAGPVCFCIGSTHPTTLGQVAALGGTNLVIPIDRNKTTDGEIRILLNRPQPAALYITGGDTATMVLSALGARSIQLHGEIVRGVPWGTLQGGIMDQVPVVTKSGGFGAPDTLVRVADFFTQK